MQTTHRTEAADYWREPMPEAIARRVLGDDHFDFSVSQGAGFCASRAHGAWLCNAQESFGAYRAAERVAIVAAEQSRAVTA